MKLVHSHSRGLGWYSIVWQQFSVRSSGYVSMAHRAAVMTYNAWQRGQQASGSRRGLMAVCTAHSTGTRVIITRVQSQAGPASAAPPGGYPEGVGRGLRQ